MNIPINANKALAISNKDKNQKAYLMEINLDDEKVHDYLEKFAQVNLLFQLIKNIDHIKIRFEFVYFCLFFSFISYIFF